MNNVYSEAVIIVNQKKENEKIFMKIQKMSARTKLLHDRRHVTQVFKEALIIIILFNSEDFHKNTEKINKQKQTLT